MQTIHPKEFSESMYYVKIFDKLAGLKGKLAGSYKKLTKIELSEEDVQGMENSFVAFIYENRKSSLICRLAHIILLTSVPPYGRDVAKYLGYKRWKSEQTPEIHLSVRDLF